ncbi:MAG: homocysteine S-methyltransferase family protein [Alphaproteobacteria bacterium]|nr:homocysteine S-methyltransferase family protein [Alphaproteobacteria bacterium]
MSYADTERHLKAGGVVILDGGTGTELERRGVAMDSGAWCGPASLQNTDVLVNIHGDYIDAGADVITTNTYASSRLRLGPAGHGDQFAEIIGAATSAAAQARQAGGRPGILIAGCVSHSAAVVDGTSNPDQANAPTEAAMADAFGELAMQLRDDGADLILLEMMFYPERMGPAFAAAVATGLPVWAGFSARRGSNGQILSFAPERDIPFAEIVAVLKDHEVAAAGIMHSPADVIGDALDILGGIFSGPLMAYPDSGYFKSPSWQFEEVMPPHELHRFASSWINQGVQIVGGCCGLSPEHIAALAPLKRVTN